VAARKTRNQIIDKRRQIIQALDRAMENLQGIEALADGQSEYITEIMPYAVILIDRCRDGIRDVLSKL